MAGSPHQRHSLPFSEAVPTEAPPFSQALPSEAVHSKPLLLCTVQVTAPLLCEEVPLTMVPAESCVLRGPWDNAPQALQHWGLAMGAVD